MVSQPATTAAAAASLNHCMKRKRSASETMSWVPEGVTVATGSKRLLVEAQVGLRVQRGHGQLGVVAVDAVLQADEPDHDRQQGGREDRALQHRRRDRG